MSDTPRRKTFAFNSKPKASSVKFELNGTWIACKNEMDGLAVLDFSALAALAESEVPAEQSQAAGAVKTFLKDAILDWEEFEKIVKAPDSGVGPEELGEIAGWLIEQYVERPTE